jgi:hypothetical protein
MKKITVKPRKPTPASPQPKGADPEWVVSMHRHYQRTGVYRAEDLNRVLGDPREQVSGETTDDITLACRVLHK